MMVQQTIWYVLWLIDELVFTVSVFMYLQFIIVQNGCVHVVVIVRWADLSRFIFSRYGGVANGSGSMYGIAMLGESRAVTE